VVRICRRRAKQSLNPAVIYELHEAINWSVASDSVGAVVITGEGSTFSSGADTRFFINSIQRGEFDRLLAFTAEGAECFRAISHCPKPVVAALNGSAIGGGLELALACHYRVATMGATLALPETGLGLVPGWQGGLRASELLGFGLAKWLVYCGVMLPARDALAIGLVDELATPNNLLDTAKQAAFARMNTQRTLNAKHDIAEYFVGHSLQQLLTGQTRTPRPRELDGIEQVLATKSPFALRMAERLFSMAERPTSSDNELEVIDQVFRSHDALVGQTALDRGERGPYPFQGR